MEFRVPELGEGVHEAELVEWLVGAGQSVRRGDGLAEIMTDKATIHLPAPFAGTIEALLAEPGETIEIGRPLLRYSPLAGNGARHALRVDGREKPGRRPARQQLPSWETMGATRSSGADGDGGSASREVVRAAPAVRKMASAMDVDLNDVAGSGPDGRVLIDDLATFVRGRDCSAARPARGSAKPAVGTPGQRMPLQGLRRTIAEHMLTSKQRIPHYSYIDECDVSNMIALRNKLKRPLYSTGVKLTNLPFYVKAIVGALQQVPLINSSLDEQTGEIILHEHYHIGIATATSKGLIVPVIHDADKKNLAEISGDIERLIRAAQNGTISREDLQGSTFTISSLGHFGGLVSTPLLHYPEVGIVAIGKIFTRPTYNEQGDIVPAQIAYLSFSFDHRVVDGSVGAVFGNAVIQQLRHPHVLAAGVMEETGQLPE